MFIKPLIKCVLYFGHKFNILYNFNYYKNYYSTLEKLSKGNTYETVKLKLLKILFICQACYLFLFFFFQNSLSHLTNLVTANFLYIEAIDQLNYIWLIIFLVNGIDIVNIIYYNNNGPTFFILYNILINSHNGYFLTHKVNSVKSKFFNFLIYLNFKLQRIDLDDSISNFIKFLSVDICNIIHTSRASINSVYAVYS